MGKTIKVRCNGPDRHENEVDLEKAIEPTIIVLRSDKSSPPAGSIPERIVLPCNECTTGKVIVTREMIEANLKTSE